MAITAKRSQRIDMHVVFRMTGETVRTESREQTIFRVALATRNLVMGALQTERAGIVHCRRSREILR